MTLLVSSLIDRIYREYLTPADDYPSYTLLETGITDSDTELTYRDDLMLPEEVDLLDVGSIIEVGRELMIVGGVDSSTNELSGLERGQFGTTAASHAAGAKIFVAPGLTRQAVFDAVVNELAGLHPPLYRVKAEEAWSEVWELPADAWGALESKYHDGAGWKPGGGFDITHDDPDSSTGISARLRHPFGDRNLLRYKASFGIPAAESDDLEGASIGFSASYAQVLIVSAVSYLVSGFDVDAKTQEFITEALERQGFPVGSGERLRNSLLTYRQLLLDRDSRRLVARDPSDAVTADPWPGFKGL